MTRIEPLCFESRGGRRFGVLELPPGPARGAVVVVHGWGGCRIGPHRILVDAARHLSSFGFATLRFDLGGRGESEGDPLEADLDMMIDDTAAALEAMAARLPGVPVGLLGMCSGGNVALAAAALATDVAAVAVWSTYPFQEQRTAKQDARRTAHVLGGYVRKLFRRESWMKLVRGRINFGLVRRALLGRKREPGERNLYRSRRDILGPLTRYPGRVLFVFGSKDPEAVDAEKMFREFAAEHGLRAEFRAVAGANHNFYSLAWKREVMGTTGEWLDEALGD